MSGLVYPESANSQPGNQLAKATAQGFLGKIL